MTSCRPSRRASFPSLGDTTRSGSCFARTRPSATAGGSPGVGHPVSPAGMWVSGDDRISYVPGEPHCALALLSDPGRTDASGHCDASARPPLCPRRRLPHSYFRGSITRLRHWLSTLRRPGCPDTTQDSLPAAGQALPDGLGYPQGSNRKVSRCILHLILLSQVQRAQGHSTYGKIAKLCDGPTIINLKYNFRPLPRSCPLWDSGIPGTRTNYSCLSNLDGRPGFRGRRTRPTTCSRRSTNVVLPSGQPVQPWSHRVPWAARPPVRTHRAGSNTGWRDAGGVRRFP